MHRLEREKSKSRERERERARDKKSCLSHWDRNEKKKKNNKNMDVRTTCQ